jgi:hypothetical protein
MLANQIRTEMNYRHVRLRNDKLSAIGLNLFYPDRQCELCIELSPPLDASIPENEVVLDELRRLYEALGNILSEQRL